MIRYITDFVVAVVAIAIGVFLGVWAYNSYLIYF